MTIYGSDDPDFLAQAVKTDASLEGPDKSRKVILTIINGNEEHEINFDRENIDDKFFELMCEFLYGRAKMDMLGEFDEDTDLHVEAVDQVVEIVGSMPISEFNPQDARNALNKSRGRIDAGEEE